jgi:flagellar hook-length control protein FliK
MNVNLLTIDSNLTAATDAGSSPSKSDSNTKSARFTLSLDDEKLQFKSHEKPTVDNTKEKAGNYEKPLSEHPSELTQSINKKLRSEKSDKTEDKTGSKEQNLTSGSNKQQSLIKSWLSEYSIAVEQNKEGTPAKAKSGHQLAQIITNKQIKSSSITENAVKSTQIKLLQTTEKGQLGIKTILLAKSNGQNGLKAITLDPSKSTPSIGKQPGTAIINEKADALAKTIYLDEKGNSNKLVTGVSKKSGGNTNTPSIKLPTMNANLTKLQDKTSETQSHPKEIDFEKLKLTAETDDRAKISQNNTNLLNSNGKGSLHSGNNTPENPGIQKINAAVAHIIEGQTKDQSNSNSNKNFSQGFEQILSQNNSHTINTEQPSISAKNITTTNQQSLSSSDVSADIGKQILESVQKSISQQSTDHQITVRLNPPELGKVLIRFQQQDTELTGLMEVNKTQTRFEIEQALPQIIRNLADCGIQIKRLEVMLSNEQQPGQGTLGNQSLQSGGSQQQYSTNPGAAGNDTALSQSNEWLTGNDSYENPPELQGALLTNDSINILI